MASRIASLVLLAHLVVPARAHAQERAPRDASVIGATLGGIAGVFVGLGIGARIGDPGGCLDGCDRTVLALSLEAASVALGATVGNRGRGSFLAAAAVSGVAVAVFADAASQERYDVAVLALLGQLAGVVAVEVATSPRVPIVVGASRTGGVEVGLSIPTAR